MTKSNAFLKFVNGKQSEKNKQQTQIESEMRIRMAHIEQVVRTYENRKSTSDGDDQFSKLQATRNEAMVRVNFSKGTSCLVKTNWPTFSNYFTYSMSVYLNPAQKRKKNGEKYYNVQRDTGVSYRPKALTLELLKQILRDSEATPSCVRDFSEFCRQKAGNDTKELDVELVVECSREYASNKNTLDVIEKRVLAKADGKRFFLAKILQDLRN